MELSFLEETNKHFEERLKKQGESIQFLIFTILKIKISIKSYAFQF